MIFFKDLGYPSFDTKVGFTNIRKFVDDLVYMLEHHPGPTDSDMREIGRDSALSLSLLFREKRFRKKPQGNVMLLLPFKVTADLLEKPVNTKANAYLTLFETPDVPVAHITEELLDLIFLYSTKNCTSASEYYDVVQADLVKLFASVAGDDYLIDGRERSVFFYYESVVCLMIFLITVAIFSNTLYTEEYIRQLGKEDYIDEKKYHDPFIDSLVSNHIFEKFAYKTDNLPAFTQERAGVIVLYALKFKLAMYEQKPELFHLKEENK
jgi:hypothetical protein